MKQSITPAERLQLIGLFALSDSYERKQREVLEAAYELLGAAVDGRDDLLEHLGIRVTDEVVEEEES